MPRRDIFAPPFDDAPPSAMMPRRADYFAGDVETACAFCRPIARCAATRRSVVVEKHAPDVTAMT
jgi:hypothetical protein